MFDNKEGDEKGRKLDNIEQKHIEDAYGSSELDSERRPTIPGTRALLIVGLIVIVAVPIALTWKAFKMHNTAEVEEEKPQQTVQQIIPSYTPRIIEEPKPLEESEKPIQTEDSSLDISPALAKLLQTTVPPHMLQDSEELARKRMLSSSLNSGGSEGSTETKTSNDNSSALNLQPIRLGQSHATQLRNRDLLITQGTQIDCTLETKIITSQPGMTTCHLTRDIYSTSGRVVLLDRGSKVVGFYQSGLQQGQTRVFVQWLRIETPSGVIVNLDSPGTGPLGEAGIGGWVDRHFWERFSGAIMVSIIGDLGEWVRGKINKSSKENKENAQSQRVHNAELIVSDVLQNSINITPTLYKHQGERVNIFVARDLDFSDVYSLVTR
ncbi:type IV secretion system protein VirB10 [Bartonella krasnovii]|uniref:Type IV secretion system protein VirB10 n=1 Tax=Bartonella krasnovii TaxID=2267275 RepID=A0ABY3VWV8_9HYPH|nr:type IV secretion system protein VirB10 [Bartonella krasnovii]UNF29025.1 type IV secretion system protein VirB10 [Bartonella krasnovii]UNF35382.1 type IV secretion system protein VirB10 [Bartonella krasnovii]UNF36997.1 type IV secretion system protein VirB10 [Bartonella krasnovii]UNF46929.1 type IV secretion system protein VirB10 [Bartonella krasnovii]UNF48568.1 type IV secretion system protein VirB10 [Bartonella krasnovii]